MYIPSSFAQPRLSVMHELMRAYPLGLLIGSDASGLSASPLPFFTCIDQGEYGTLRGHMAKANPHWRALQNAAECLVSFQGPQGYISPSWYLDEQSTHQVVPTWDYATVQVWGTPKIIDDPGWILHQLTAMTDEQEQQRSCPWSVADAPSDYIARQIQAIVGIEIPIARIEGKWKMSQNRARADRRALVDALRGADPVRGDPQLADWIAAQDRDGDEL
jgi:transcriptional regulator